MARTNTADITPATYTYEWADAEQTSLRRTDAEGKAAFVPADPRNRDYAEFLSSKATAAAYKAPPAPPEPTLTEKLANAGIDLAELTKHVLTNDITIPQ